MEYNSGKPRIKPNLVNCEHEERLNHMFAMFKVLQTPWRCICAAVGVIHAILTFLFWSDEPSDQDIIDYVLGSTLSMLVRPHPSIGPTGFAVSVRKCLLKYKSGDIKRFQMVFTFTDQSEAKIHSFLLNGKQVVTNHVMMTVLGAYHVLSIHTKCHLFSNNLIKYILDRNLTILMPSTKSSIPLHNGLLTSKLSPIIGFNDNIIGKWHAAPVDYNSVLDESRNMDALSGHASTPIDATHPSQYLRYLNASRSVLEGVMKSHNVPSHLKEALFNHIIVHSTDHISTWKITKYIQFGWVLHDSKVTRFQSLHRLITWNVWIQPIFNPWTDLRIADENQPFYQDLYAEMKHLDSQYGFNFADDITVSVAY